jgi:hypothetical protein
MLSGKAGDVGGDARLHVPYLLLGARVHHATSGDVEEGQDARLGGFDPALAEIEPVLPPGRAGVDDRRHSGGRAMCVGVQSDHVSLRARGKGVHVGVDVDQTRRDHAAAHVHNLGRIGGGDVWGHTGDRWPANAHVQWGVDPVCGVDHAPVLEQ